MLLNLIKKNEKKKKRKERMAASRQRIFTKLEVRQGVGTLTIEQSDTCLTLKTEHQVVAYCDDRTNSLSIYGLASARRVSYEGQDFIEYINNSTKSIRCIGSGGPRSTQKQIYENFIARDKFTAPCTVIKLSRARLSLTSILLDGYISLNNINAECIDKDCNTGKIFTVTLHKTAALRCPLAAIIVNIRMHEETIVSCYQMVGDHRCVWSVHNAIFDVSKCRRIEGIKVVNALTINAPTQQWLSASISREASCTYKTVPGALALIEDAHTSLRSSPVTLGTVFVEDDFDYSEILHRRRRGRQEIDPLQHVLDASRREYEADSTPLPMIPKEKRTPVGGNIKAVAKLTEKQDERCAVCLSNRANVAFSCGHVAICPDCVDGYRAVSSTCPFCREPIKHITILYLGDENVIQAAPSRQLDTHE